MFFIFKKEIEVLKPKLILSLGKKSSEYLLNKKISLKESHGNIYDYNDATKVLVMYHPSGVDRFMKREIYTTQLKEVFEKIGEDKIDDIESIFGKQPDQAVKPQIENLNDESIPKIFKGLEFILPAVGNEITQNDISNNQLRVTADFKNLFPSTNAKLRFLYKGIEYKVQFTHRGKRSHILKLGYDLMHLLNLTASDSVKITKLNPSKYAIEKVVKFKNADHSNLKEG